MDELTAYLMQGGDDGVWDRIRAEAEREVAGEPALASFLFAAVLRHARLEDALSYLLAGKLQSPDLGGMLLRDLVGEALAADAAAREPSHPAPGGRGVVAAPPYWNCVARVPRRRVGYPRPRAVGGDTEFAPAAAVPQGTPE